MDNNTKKVGIITLNGYHNYGNKLQNYALQEIVNTLGYQANTIIIEKDKNYTLIRKVRNALKKSPKKIIKNLIERKKHKNFYKNNKNIIDNRTKVFKDFSKQYLNEIFLCEANVNKFVEDYEYFITGSDQVWNPIYINDMDKYFLTFVPNKKRISYAASFSCPHIPDKYQDKYRTWILGMSKISVREKIGSNIIKRLTGIEVPVLLDPTLLLSEKKWRFISKKDLNKPKESYILTYFLGEISEENKEYIEKVAKEKKLTIIHLADIKYHETYETGPSQFIDYINSASVLFTDSFHGVVFSILMKTPFVVFQRISKSISMYSRIETLLDMFNLRSREAQNIKKNGQIFNMDYSHIEPILEVERKKSIDYLRKSLNVK